MNKEKQSSEVLSVSDFIDSFKLKLQERLANVRENKTWDEWHDGVKFGREDMLEEIIDML